MTLIIAKLTKVEPYGGASAPDGKRWTFTIHGEGHEGQQIRILTSKQNLTWSFDINQPNNGAWMKRLVRELQLANAYDRELKVGVAFKLS